MFNDTATTKIYTLSLHDALPISQTPLLIDLRSASRGAVRRTLIRLFESPINKVLSVSVLNELYAQSLDLPGQDRKSTRLNSSHANTSYAAFCLKHKKTTRLNSSHLHERE